jgi:hypothetical protein
MSNKKIRFSGKQIKFKGVLSVFVSYCEREIERVGARNCTEKMYMPIIEGVMVKELYKPIFKPHSEHVLLSKMFSFFWTDSR